LAQSLLEKNLMEITYKDDDGEYINVSDDEDLKAAYELAEGSMKGKINFFVKPRLMVKPKTAKEADKVGSNTDSVVATMTQDSSPKVYQGKKKDRKPKKEKDATPSYQKRAFKKLIKKELNKQSDLVFNDLFKLPEYHEENKSNEAIDKL